MRIFRVLVLASLAVATLDAAIRSETYRLDGTILREDGRPFLHSHAALFLHGAVKPYFAKADAGPDGKFRFKNVPADTYTLIVTMPRIGEIRKTIEVGPGLADAKKRVAVAITIDRAATMENGGGVSATELSIPYSAKQEYSKAEQCIARRDIQGAVASLNRAVEMAPQFAIAWNFLGTIAHQTGKFAEAEGYFREALRQDPGQYPPLVNLGGTLISQGKIDEALLMNQRAAAANPRDPLAQAQLGISYFYLGRLDDAEIHLRKAKTLDAGHFTSPQLFLSEIYANRGQISAAISEIEELLKLHPDAENASTLRKTLESLRARIER